MTMINKLYRQTGFTLLEVLVALIILAIGLLGLASLQAVGLRSNHSAQLRTQATILSYDIIDRMRANSLEAEEAGANNKYFNSVGDVNVDCEANTCTAEEMADYDLAEWNAALDAALPSAEGIVCVDDDPTDAATGFASPGCVDVGNDNEPYVVKIWWVDDQDSNDKQQFFTSFQP